MGRTASWPSGFGRRSGRTRANPSTNAGGRPGRKPGCPPGEQPQSRPTPDSMPDAIRRWWANIKRRSAACSATRRRGPANGAVAETACRRRGPSQTRSRRDGHVACQQSDAGGEFPARRSPARRQRCRSPTAAFKPRTNFTQYLNDAVQTIGFGSPHAESDRQPRVRPHAQPVPRQGRRGAGPLPRIRLQRSGRATRSWTTRSTDRSSRSTTRRPSSKPFRPPPPHGPVFPGEPGQPLPIYPAAQREPTAADRPGILDTRPELRQGVQSSPIRCRRTMSPPTTNSN